MENKKGRKPHQCNARQNKKSQSLGWNLGISAERITERFPHHAKGDDIFDGNGKPKAVSIGKRTEMRNYRKRYLAQEIEHNRTEENGELTHQVSAQHDSHDQAFHNGAADPRNVIYRVKIWGRAAAKDSKAKAVHQILAPAVSY